MKLFNDVNWYGRAMRRYATFSGRATRSEFWFFTLVSGLLGLLASMLDQQAHLGGVLYLLVTLVHALPSVSVFVRPMHDVDRTGWWFLAPLTLVGIIPVIAFLCRRGTPGPNRFGLPDGSTATAAALAVPAASPAGMVAATSGEGRDPIREIERLAELHARGALTDAEFARMKTQVFATPVPASPEPRFAPAPPSTL